MSCNCLKSKPQLLLFMLIITKVKVTVSARIEISMEEKGSYSLLYNSPKRRKCSIALIVLSLLVFFGIGILAGYFIGRGAAKGCDDGDKNDRSKPKGDTQEQLEVFHKRAVDMISTVELRKNLK